MRLPAQCTIYARISAAIDTYATHLLEAGLPVHRLQRLMGHQSVSSTLRYVHWVPSYREGEGDLDLIGKLEGMDDE